MTERLTRRMLDEYDGTGIEVKGEYGLNSVHHDDFETEDFYDRILARLIAIKMKLKS